VTTEILLVFLLLAGVVVVFATRVLRVDVTALLVLVLVAVLGLAPTPRALAGFSNPAVIAIAGMFVISAGLSRTGVAGLVGKRILEVAGRGELRLVVVITLVSGILSGFMNNIGVAAMMLPVVVDIARKVSLPPSKLLIPMALGAQLGGFTTLIGTSPNLLAGDALREAGLEPFGLFAFTPVGGVLLIVGTVVVALVGPRLLPERKPRTPREAVDRSGLREGVEMEDRLFRLTVPRGSVLDGKTLEESLIGSALGLHVMAIERGGRRRLAPRGDVVLRAGDHLLVHGSPDEFLALKGRRHLVGEADPAPWERLESEEVGLIRVRIAPGSSLVGQVVAETHFKMRHGVVILAVRREGFRRRTHLMDTRLQAGDELLIQGPRGRLHEMAGSADFEGADPLMAAEAVQRFDLQDRLWSVRVTEDSILTDRPLGKTRLGEWMGIVVLAVHREGPEGEGGTTLLLPGPDILLRPGDHLLVKARPDDMLALRGLQRLEADLDLPVTAEELEGPGAGFVEAVLAPRSSLIGKTLGQSDFRGRFGMHVVAVVREGEVIRGNLRDRVLGFGDALLMYGTRRRAEALRREADLIPLAGAREAPPDLRRAPLALGITGVALLPVIFGWLPVQVGVLIGAVLLVMSRCLKPDEAYRAVDWPILVIVAGMLALGAALDETGAARLLGEGVLAVVGGFGPYGVMVALVLLTAVGGQIMPAPAVVVLMAPVALSGAAQLDISPYPLVMAVAIAATSLASPVSQPAHALVMGPAGYRLGDYLRLGIPLTLVVLALTILITPLILPF
jgi:di/tricarboxylate transporter